ncbi:hypothetical protein PIB30_009347 [Stylosanthes scabra]|uniref:Uncharacterized protein n=1 Tax=Stylosanthes scabra TaxID=79078 RepID=A0ABU6U6Q9_9FABA|nr:hypothetical protein [Stylosanthes scabra]
MLSLRFTAILLVTFILLPLTFSTTLQVSLSVRKTLAVASGSMLEKARSSSNVEQIGEAAFSLGRKMMSRNSSSSSSIKTKKHCKIAECKNKNQQQQQEGNSLNTKENDGFIPLNADYFVPRPHPPKNN